MASSERFEFELPAELAAFMHSQVGRGALVSESDVVQEALRMMQRQDAKLAQLRAMVETSIGDPRPSLTPDQVRDRLRERAQSYDLHGDHA